MHNAAPGGFAASQSLQPPRTDEGSSTLPQRPRAIGQQGHQHQQLFPGTTAGEAQQQRPVGPTTDDVARTPPVPAPTAGATAAAPAPAPSDPPTPAPGCSNPTSTLQHVDPTRPHDVEQWRSNAPRPPAPSATTPPPRPPTAAPDNSILIDLYDYGSKAKIGITRNKRPQQQDAFFIFLQR